jgi:hypothetical protein
MSDEKILDEELLYEVRLLSTASQSVAYLGKKICNLLILDP